MRNKNVRTTKKRNRIVSVPFTYDLPDDYLYQTNDLGKTGEWTWTGPDKIWVWVRKDNNRIKSRNYLTERDDGDLVPPGPDEYKAFIDCEQNPLLASLFDHDGVDYGMLPHTEETLPDGSVYARPVSPPPDHTYELMDIEFDPVTGTFLKPYPWKRPHMTWARLKQSRNALLGACDSKISVDMPQAMKDAWIEYRQKLRDLPTTFDGVDPWKVPFPEEPMPAWTQSAVINPNVANTSNPRNPANQG